jgi:hypothetical protein
MRTLVDDVIGSSMASGEMRGASFHSHIYCVMTKILRRSLDHAKPHQSVWYLLVVFRFDGQFVKSVRANSDILERQRSVAVEEMRVRYRLQETTTRMNSTLYGMPFITGVPSKNRFNSIRVKLLHLEPFTCIISITETKHTDYDTHPERLRTTTFGLLLKTLRALFHC